MNSDNDYHQPVLVDTVLRFLHVDPDGIYVDATVGGGGHARRIASRLGVSGRLVAIDRDADAVAEAKLALHPFAGRVTIIQGTFDRIREIVLTVGKQRVNGILFDLGLSGHHIDTAARGFSFAQTGPLDMRMDTQISRTARDLVNSLSIDQLTQIFREYGEERRARTIARRIAAAREIEPIDTTDRLAEIAGAVANPRYRNKTLSRVFQALRIAVNDEIGQLERGLEEGWRILASGGRMVVISYHSLEDRRVKYFFRARASGSEDYPADGTVLTKKPVRPEPAEVAANPRARSAKLRAAEKR